MYTSLWRPFCILFMVSVVAAIVFTPLAKHLANKFGAIDFPNARRINKVPIPRMGGIAVFIALIFALLTQYIGTKFYGWPSVLIPNPRMSVNYYLLGISFLAIFLVGAIDDIYQLKPLPKLIGQILAATIAASGGLVIGDIANPFIGGEFISLGWFAYPFTVFYLVGFANIINLIDGLDGLASGISCISTLTMFILAFIASRLDAAALSIAICGATLGFLRYNFHPAQIFLGDSGSLLLGFSLGTISILSMTKIAGLTTIILPLVLAGIPMIDTVSSIIRRLRAHVSIGHFDKGHIHHRLMEEGYNQRQAVIIIYIWTFALCAGSVVMTQVELIPRIAIFATLLIGSGFIIYKLHLFSPVLLHHRREDGKDELIGPDNPSFKDEVKHIR